MGMTMFEKTPVGSLISATISGIFSGFQGTYAFFWLFGAWLPWWIVGLYGFLCGTYALSITQKTIYGRIHSWNGLLPWYSIPSLAGWTWLILWLLHFAPDIRWPLL